MNEGAKTVALLGATGHIAKSLIHSFKDEPNFILHLFSRSLDKTQTFVNEHNITNAKVYSYEHFGQQAYSGIINCVGIGDPTRLKQYPDEVFFVTEEIDQLIIQYLRKNPQTIYINFSSGAVHGTEFKTSVTDNSVTDIAINRLTLSDYYGIAKINAEAKHRALHQLNIVDLRIFGFYSRFIELNRPYLLADVISALKSGRKLITTQSNIIRDYIHPHDLFSLVLCCLNRTQINTAFDVSSKKPISKFDLLEYFKKQYDLDFEVIQGTRTVSVTGNKDNYFSESKRTTEIGFEARYTSLECIAEVTHAIVEQTENPQ